ncbi:gentisate 1,2-dioxygenase [Cupriavidus necator]|uniref:gentisate 1,2-dioxygenase n=1 Tax=Cupriavidus necator TaxID=106590 RepID=UPI0039C1D671
MSTANSFAQSPRETPHTVDSTSSEYYQGLVSQNLAPLWVSLSRLVPEEPKPKAQAFAWSFADVFPRLLEAGELISAEQAERRVLVLENPTLAGQSRITDTLYAGLQLILPGEVAPAHRHTQSALRFAMHGHGAYTAVNGERVAMAPGDFIITPAWTWHDHGSHADGPVVWLDGLDVPLVSFLHAGFRQQHEETAQSLHRSEGESLLRYGSGLLRPDDEKTATSPLFKYSYERTRAALELITRREDMDLHRGYEVCYVNPTTGDTALPTIGASMRLLPKGFGTRPYRSTDGTVLVCVEGKLRVSVEGNVFTLTPQDVLAVPGWHLHQIEAESESVFFSFSDAPVHKKLALWREERQ